MAGGDAGVAWMRDIALEIAQGGGLRFKLGPVQQRAGEGLPQAGVGARGRITPLNPAPEISEAIIERSLALVAMMGHEPIAEAIEAGADVILAGRASDTALFAAVPLMRKSRSPDRPGTPPKILECGTASTVQRKRPDSIFAWGARRSVSISSRSTRTRAARRRASPRTRSTRMPIQSSSPSRVARSIPRSANTRP